MKLIDTNILIELFGQTADFGEVETKNIISRISYLEFLSWSELSESEVQLISFVMKQKFTILEVDSQIADHATRLRRTKNIRLGDAIILATALENNLELKTYDRNLYSQFLDLSSK